ncbi:MAG: DUF2878 family protein [Pseudobdellovibrio sp.]
MKISVLLPILIFNSLWFAIVFLAHTSFSYLTVLLPWPLLLFEFYNKRLLRNQIGLLFALAIAGYLFDVVLSSLGGLQFFEFGNQVRTPIWLASMWLLFAFVLPSMSSAFEGKLKTTFIVGAVLGPLSYLSGEKFALLHFTSNEWIALDALFWGFYFSYCISVLRRKSG